jgi:spore coat protein CotH
MSNYLDELKKKRFIIKRFNFLLLIALLSCSDNEDTDADLNFIVPTINPKGDEQYLNLGSEFIFDQNVLHTFELKIPKEDLEKIDSDPVAEQYVEGMLIFKGDTISPVGIRYKGSIGAFVGCVDGPNIFEPSGKKICTKLSMKVKINWNGREERFYGLKKLQFHSQNLDPSQMHERIGYWLFRAMGVEAPRSVHARLMINDDYSGLYALTEQIDGSFTDYHFDDQNGNVYKEVWPLTNDGTPTNEQSFIVALKTNEDDNPSVALMSNFAEKLSMAADAELQNVISEYMDINKIVSFAVVDRAIRNDDGPFHWYCEVGGCGNHNYYWYEEPNNQKINLIPWDLDNAFENILSNANPVTPIADEWGETSNNCQPFPYGPFFIPQRSAACD